MKKRRYGENDTMLLAFTSQSTESKNLGLSDFIHLFFCDSGVCLASSSVLEIKGSLWLITHRGI